ncbi:OVARIAN TUMOR DOMAIN-containing deubiquitinating enzyme 4-like protein [Drosera capensis]
MLALLCGRHHPPSKPWLLHSSHSFPHHDSHFGVSTSVWRNSNAATMVAPSASDWQRDFLLPAFLNHHHNYEQKGEGSWNVAWDARPARWLRRVDVAWLMFGVCAWLGSASSVDRGEVDRETGCPEREKKCGVEVVENGGVKKDEDGKDGNIDYRVTGVPADGRCLFRAIVHGACLQSGEAAPDENRQRELADELRAKVVEELLKRRDEIQWFVEEDFDTYIKRIQQPYVWGGEPELVMAAHVLKTPISVYMKDKRSGVLTKISNYGEEYQRNEELSINVLFHGYGHYDSLETSLNHS